MGLEEMREEKDSHSNQHKKLDGSHVEAHRPSKRENDERVHKSQGNGWTAESQASDLFLRMEETWKVR